MTEKRDVKWSDLTLLQKIKNAKDKYLKTTNGDMAFFLRMVVHMTEIGLLLSSTTTVVTGISFFWKGFDSVLYYFLS